jgi:hypothetical protein
MSFIPVPTDANGYVPMSLADTAALDGFQRLRVSQSHTLFDSQQEYGLDTLRTWDCTANGALPTILSPNGSVVSGGNSVGPRAISGMTPITCSSTAGHYSILQSRQFPRYVPGFAHLILTTGIFATNASYLASIVLRTDTSGSPTDVREISQVDWNIDKFDGSGPSGITLDLTKTQILWIGAQWLGVGRVMVGFDINGRLWPAHQFLNANILTVPYCRTFNLPVRYEVVSDTSTTARVGYFELNNGVFLKTVNSGAGGTIHFTCCSVQSEGAFEARGFPQSQSMGITPIPVTTRSPVFSIRPSLTFQGMTNRAHIEIEDFWLTAATNSSVYEIVIGGTLTGASWLPVGNPTTAGSFIAGTRYKIISIGSTNFTLIGAASNTVGLSFVATGVGTGTGTATPEVSVAEYDTSATTIVGGASSITGEIVAGSGATRLGTSGTANFRNPLVLGLINALTAKQHTVSIVCTSTSGTSSIRAGMNWHEQVN